MTRQRARLYPLDTYNERKYAVLAEALKDAGDDRVRIHIEELGRRARVTRAAMEAALRNAEHAKAVDVEFFAEWAEVKVLRPLTLGDLSNRNWKVDKERAAAAMAAVEAPTPAEKPEQSKDDPRDGEFVEGFAFYVRTRHWHRLWNAQLDILERKDDDR